MHKRRLLALALALALCLGLATPAMALSYGEEYAGYSSGYGQQYIDVPLTHWAGQSIQTCSERSWFNGYPDGTFRPNNLITREEAANVVAVAMGLTVDEDPAVTFTDTANNWAKAYIEATKALFPNVTNLQGTASFRPTQTITREETIYALVVAWRYASKATNADLSILNMFSDSNSISAGVKPYMAVAVQEGLVSGLPDGTIAAQKGLTRAEFATLLARALGHGYGPDDTSAAKIAVDYYDAVTTDEQVTVTGKVTPSSGVTLTLDGKSVSLDKSGAFAVDLRLVLGDNSFALQAVNRYGVKSETSVFITREAAETPSASQPTEPMGPAQQTEPERVVVGTGQCGFNLTWKLYEDGELVISGTGDMWDMVSPDSRPWCDQRMDIKRISIEDGVTSIGNCAFIGCSAATSITIPNSVTEIGYTAFADCSSLSEITFPNGVTGIFNATTFEGCTSLTSIVVPNGITLLGDGAFRNCTGLINIAIPAGVTFISQNAFEGCDALENVYYAGSWQQWESITIGDNNDDLIDAIIHYNSPVN